MRRLQRMASKMEHEETKKTEQEKKHFRYGTILYLILIFACAVLVPKYVMQRTVVDGSSMTNTLHNDENLLVNKFEYRFTDPERYDIIIFHPKGSEEGTLYVKRVYGLPGETIQIIDGNIYVNQKKIEDSFAKKGTKDPGIAENPITLGKDEYFVLGDNRQGSSDSRDPDVGLVNRKNITGHVVLRIWPLSQFGIPK